MRSISANPKILTTKPRRHAAALVEAAFVLPALMILILGMLDFGLATLNRNNLAAAAIRLARAASLHGEKSSPERTPWGPTAYEGTAAGAGEVAGMVRPYLAVMQPSQVQIRLEWPDSSNALNQRVRVTLRHDQTPICMGFFGSTSWTQRAVAVTRIQH